MSLLEKMRRRLSQSPVAGRMWLSWDDSGARGETVTASVACPDCGARADRDIYAWSDMPPSKLEAEIEGVALTMDEFAHHRCVRVVGVAR